MSIDSKDLGRRLPHYHRKIIGRSDEKALDNRLLWVEEKLRETIEEVNRLQEIAEDKDPTA